MPGLCDSHMHTGQQLLKGQILDALPMIWTRIMLPFESTLTPEKMELSAELAALEMIKSGTTSFVDAGSYFMESAADVYLQSGLRGLLSASTWMMRHCRMLSAIPPIRMWRRQMRCMTRTMEKGT